LNITNFKNFIMSYPATYTAYRRTTGPIPNTIEQRQESLPKDLNPHDVVIKNHAVSLNYRDVGMLIGNYPAEIKEGGIPCSDCAAEVVAIGSAVKKFAVGDKVAAICGIGDYEDTDDLMTVAIGAGAEGVLGEYALFQDKHLVHLPANLSWEEVSYSDIVQSRAMTLTRSILGINACLCRCHGMGCTGWTETCSERSCCFVTRLLPPRSK
jgi:NADPH:quinone reductase-like Zn-dependent oxidoreductase